VGQRAINLDSQDGANTISEALPYGERRITDHSSPAAAWELMIHELLGNRDKEINRAVILPSRIEILSLPFFASLPFSTRLWQNRI
jgi:hypothetical protein